MDFLKLNFSLISISRRLVAHRQLRKSQAILGVFPLDLLVVFPYLCSTALACSLISSASVAAAAAVANDAWGPLLRPCWEPQQCRGCHYCLQVQGHPYCLGPLPEKSTSFRN